MTGNPIVELRGKRQSNYYDKNGELRRWKELHVIYTGTPNDDENEFDPDAPGEFMVGDQVGILACPRGVNFERLEIGNFYQLEYELRPGRDGTRAYLVNIKPYEVGIPVVAGGV